MSYGQLLQEIGLEEIPASDLDLRSEDAIIQDLQVYVPVTSERNIWAFWDSGFGAMPPWMQRNVIGWVRREGKSWTVRVLDIAKDSPTHVLNYVDAKNFPEAFSEGKMNGKDASQHVADFARVAVLYQYGGVYMDVSIMLIRDLNTICWLALEDPTSQYEIAGMAQQLSDHPGQMLNSFIACRRHNTFIYRWQQVFLRMWSGRNDAVGLHDHPLVRHIGLLRLQASSIPANADWAGFTDYLAQILAFERVRLNREPGQRGFDGPAYFNIHFFLLDANTEMFRGQDFDGAERLAHMLLLPCTAPWPRHIGSHQEQTHICAEQTEASKDEDQRLAQQFTYAVLAHSSLCKFSQGTARLGLKFVLGKYWSRPENSMVDCQPGTWGCFLRYGSVHLRQTRMRGRYLEPLRIARCHPEGRDSGTVAALYEPIA
ncbi:hypothetical protein F5Y01DRAFT_309142 [Xylaria sp. FL0043]|nr:hypothetical protein F5Y01DRAFT_309142 [Xylaria sp. FL0043]